MYILTMAFAFFMFATIAHITFPWWVYTAVVVACYTKKELPVIAIIIVAFALIIARQDDIQDCRDVAPVDKEFIYDPVTRVCDFV